MYRLGDFFKQKFIQEKFLPLLQVPSPCRGVYLLNTYYKFDPDTSIEIDKEKKGKNAVFIIQPCSA